MIEVNYDDIVRFARLHYECEGGTKRAVDEGLMTLEDLTLYKYVVRWTTNNTPEQEDGEDVLSSHQRWRANLPQALSIAAEVFNVSNLEAKRIYEKVREIPHGAQAYRLKYGDPKDSR